MLNRLLLSLVLSLMLVLPALAQTTTPTPDPEIAEAAQAALDRYRARPGIRFDYRIAGSTTDATGGVFYLQLYDLATGDLIPGIVDFIVVVPDENGGWYSRINGEPGYAGAYSALSPGVVRQIDARPYKPYPDDTLTALVTPYRLPWGDGQFATVTRSFGWHGRGMIDFDLSAREVTAAKDGTIVYAYDGSTTNAHDAGGWWYWNTVVIEHGPNEYSLYGHLDAGSLPAAIRDACTTDFSAPNCAVPVTAGQVIGLEGSTGFSSNPHLHIEFGQQYGIIAYTDVLDVDSDGDRAEPVYAAHIFAEHNVPLRGFSADDVAAWPYGLVQQASHRETPPENLNLVRNPGFDAGTDDWKPTGQLNWTVENGVLRVLRLNTAEPPDWAAFYQDLNYGGHPATPFEVSVQLGNASGINKVVTLALVNTSGWDYGALTCDFLLAQGAPMQTYRLRGVPEATWANIRLQLLVNPPDSAPAVLVDNVSVVRLADADLGGVECAGPL